MPNTQPSISVVIPCYNVGNFIAGSVQSAIEQTYDVREIICVDDGSTDDTVAVLQNLKAHHPEQIDIIEGKHAGASAARNRGLQKATGDFVQFLDADDVLKSQKLERQVEAIRCSEKPVDLVVGDYLQLLPDGSQRIRQAGGENQWADLIMSRMGTTSPNLWRKEAVEQAGNWSEEWPTSEEYELMFRLLAKGAYIEHVREPLTIKREREDSLSHSMPGTDTRKLRFYGAVLNHLRNKNLLNSPSGREVLDSVFKRIRWVYQRYPETAVKAYKEIMPPDYVPSVSAFNTAAYVRCLRYFGFEYAEKIRSAKIAFRRQFTASN